MLRLLILLAIAVGAYGFTAQNLVKPECKDYSPLCPVLCSQCDEQVLKHEDQAGFAFVNKNQNQRGKRSPKENQRVFGLLSKIPFPDPFGWFSGNDDKKGSAHTPNPQQQRPPKRPNPVKEVCQKFDGVSIALIDSFCPKSCNRCGQANHPDPMAAAKLYVQAECNAMTLMSETTAGFAL